MVKLLVDLHFVPTDDVLPQAVASRLGTLLDARWDKACFGGRWRRFGGDLVDLANTATRPSEGLQATSALGHRLELGKHRLLLTLAAADEVAVVARNLRSFVLACPMELDLGSVRAVGEAEVACPGRFDADAVVDVATDRSFDLHVDPPCAWEALASDPLPPGVGRDVADGIGVLSWTSTFDPEACRRALSVRSSWLLRTLGGRDVPTGAEPEAPCRPEWRPPAAQVEARLHLPTSSIAKATRVVRLLVEGEPGRSWPKALEDDSAGPFAVRTGRPGAREHVLHLLPSEARPRSLPKLTFTWTADEVVVRYGPLLESQRGEGQSRVDRLIEKVHGAELAVVEPTVGSSRRSGRARPSSVSAGRTKGGARMRTRGA